MLGEFERSQSYEFAQSFHVMIYFCAGRLVAAPTDVFSFLPNFDSSISCFLRIEKAAGICYTVAREKKKDSSGSEHRNKTFSRSHQPLTTGWSHL